MTSERVGEPLVPRVLQRSCGRGCAPGSAPEEVPSTVQETLRSPGRPLDERVRTDVEAPFSHDLRAVRIHADPAAAKAAADVDARAFTVGRHVVFGEGRFQPGTPDGRRLLLHELTHTLQQRGGAGGSEQPPVSGLRVEPDGTAAEAQAEGVATESVAPHETAGPARPTAPAVQRQPVDRSITQPDLGGINLQLREDGRVDVTVVGPKVPAIGSPALGLRRLPNRRTEFLFGGSGKVITPAELPDLLRGSLDNSSRQPPGRRTPLPLRLPTCRELRRLDGTVRPWVEHRIEAILQGRQPLSEPFYDGLVDACPATPSGPALTGPEPAGPETMPVGPDEAIA